MSRTFQFYATACLAMSVQLAAQPPAPLKIRAVVERALQNYPAIGVSQEQVSAAAAGIQLARTAYLPRVDLLAQVNRATRNNVFGLLLPQSVIPSMSGPVLGTNNFGSVWGSAVGGLVTWEPFDFGLRGANVAIASAGRAQADASLKRTKYEIAVAAADAYLTLAAAEEAVRAAQAGVDRAETIFKTINALVMAELRPGADASRAQAELAAARTQLIQAQQAVGVARAVVAQFIGGDPNQIVIDASKLNEIPRDRSGEPFNAAQNPLSLEQDAAIDHAKAELHALERSYFPRFYLHAAAYGRGSGAEVNGDRLGGLSGLAPNFQNYALGFSVTFPVFDFASIRARESVQAANMRAQTARYQQIATDLRARWNTAEARLSAARKVAANTPVEVSAARATVEQATARYRSGLANIDEVAEAERLLTQAEIDDALARLAIWRGLLDIATAAGDIQPFLFEASQ